MKVYFLLTILLLFATLSYAQISPGNLTNAHAEFEGMSNCTLCHELGKKVSNSKCLDCHKEINSLVEKNEGFHSSNEVNNKDCFLCHSEHHGRKFDMIRFNEDDFNHELTGYELEGQHEIIDCRKCHVPDFIENTELKKRPNTFLGLDTKCIACHDDFHQNTLSTDNCAACHDIESFTPAPNFEHSKTDFILKGSHEDVDCKECHELTTKNGKDFQQFNDIAFNDCKSCHEDPHNKRIKGRCSQCHTEDSFFDFKGKGRFNHNLTNFTLKGKHLQVDCFSCHTKTSSPLVVFQENNNISESSCVECHEDIHDGKFSNDCAKCHNERSFSSLITMDFFDHKLTDYPLIGVHKKIDCNKCHEEGKCTDTLEFSSCNSCHTDYHEGEFIKTNFSPDCKECHSLDTGFDTSLFTIERHETTQFPLQGAHLATPCFACHVDESDNRWSFKDNGTNCIDCHEDIHKGFITEKYYPENDCKSCHENESWTTLEFNHATTNWPLEGKHLEVECRNCHIQETENTNIFSQQFANLDNNCTTCHENNHGTQFAINRETDCVRCHVFESWIPEKFDHNTTNFNLEGKHAEIDCKQCHKSILNNVDKNINYKIKKYQCIDCHS